MRAGVCVPGTNISRVRVTHPKLHWPLLRRQSGIFLTVVYEVLA